MGLRDQFSANPLDSKRAKQLNNQGYSEAVFNEESRGKTDYHEGTTATNHPQTAVSSW
jgi:hypothetical protein